MSAERKLVYRLDEGVAPSGVPEELHIILGDGLSGSGIGATDLFLSGCPQGVPTFKLTPDWPEWYREVYGHAGHSSEPSNPVDSRRDETGTPDRQEHQGSNPSGLDRSTEVNHSGVGASEPVLEREVQRGDDTVLYRFIGLGPSTGTYEIWWEHGDPASRVLCHGGKHEAVVAGYVAEQRRGGWVLATIFNRERGLQVPEDSRPPQAHDGRTEKPAGDPAGESVL